MKKISKIFINTIAVANIITILLMLVTGYSGYTSTESRGALLIADLFFPFFLAANMSFLVLWIFIKPARALIPAAGLIICYIPVRTYMPLNMNGTKPDGTIKVLSYNVCFFSFYDDKEKNVVNPIFDYILNSGADIVCLQEASNNEQATGQIPREIYSTYQFRDTFNTANSETLLLLSKYPVIERKHIDYDSNGNLSAAYKLKTGNDTIMLVNNHLESVGFSFKDKDDFKRMVKGDMDKNETRANSENLIKKIIKGERKRILQAKAVRDYVNGRGDMPVIITGDFNSSPLSHTHRIMSEGLTDCYVASANGCGWSYTDNHMYVRIDNILCSDDFTPYDCKVDNTVRYSDHYPIMTCLKKN